jgi:hypothetical protein
MRTPDPRFADYGYQLMLLREHAKLLEQHHPALLETGKRVLRSELGASDDADRSMASRLEAALDDGVATRFVPGSILLAAWAIFEEAVNDVADYAYWKLDAPIEFKDVRGDLANRAAKYFTDVLGLRCLSAPGDVSTLQDLSLLHGLIGHANGRLSRMSARRDHFEKWARSQPDVAIVGGEYVVVGFGFVDRWLGFLRGLITRMEEEVSADGDAGVSP